MKISQLIERSARDWNQLSSKELRQSYQQVKHVLAERAKTFAKHGAEGRTLPSSRGLSDADIRTALKEASAYMRGKVSTYKGYAAYQNQRLKAMQDAMPEMGFKTREDVAKFGKFMDEMDDRYGNIKYDSHDAKKLYQQAQRLNVDPNKFMKNFDYWMDHVEDLEDLKPIKQRAGSRALKPSDYARKIKNKKKERKGSE